MTERPKLHGLGCTTCGATLEEDGERAVCPAGHERPAAEGVGISKLGSRRKQFKDAQRLLQRIKTLKGVVMRVYRVNEHALVAARHTAQAIKWYAEQEADRDTPEGADVHAREVSLNQNLPLGDTGEQWPLWFHIADHFRVLLSEHTAGWPLPDTFFDPFIIATTKGDQGDE